MSLQHLIDAITSESNEEIQHAEAESRKRIEAAQKKDAEWLQKRKADMDVQVENRKTTLRAKSEAHSKLSGRSAVLAEKQKLVESVFDDVLEKVSALSDSEVEPILKNLLKDLPTDGEIRPSKKHEALVRKLASGRAIGSTIDAKGGFLFVGSVKEINCTFEHLIHSELRNKAELMIGKTFTV